ncbi:MAG: glycosyltransferase family 4 protein [Clostridia bacterium]|nr:glycosyltransferase family 4 protein [Clostridia bacterium]
MKLAFVTDSKFYTENGVWYCDLMNYDLIKKFRVHFDSITVIATARDEKMDCVKIDFNGVSVKVVPKITNPKNFIKSRKSIINTITAEVTESDAVFCRIYNGIIAQKAAKKLGKPVVTYFGCSYYESLMSIGSLHKKLAAPFAQWAFKKSAMESDNVIYCSPHLEKEYPTKGNVFIWTDIYREKCGDIFVEKRINADLTQKAEIKVALVGQIYNNIKGIDTAIRAISCLPPEFNLYLLGKGKPDKWVTLAKKLKVFNRIHFCGCLPGGKQVLNWLDTMDIYVQPSRTEGLPMATLEAMSRGLPVISSGVGGLSYVTLKELIHRTDDFKQMAHCIKSVAGDRELYKKAVQFSLNEVQKYSTDKHDRIFDSMCLALKNSKEN